MDDALNPLLIFNKRLSSCHFTSPVQAIYIILHSQRLFFFVLLNVIFFDMPHEVVKS